MRRNHVPSISIAAALVAAVWRAAILAAYWASHPLRPCLSRPLRVGRAPTRPPFYARPPCTRRDTFTDQLHHSYSTSGVNPSTPLCPFIPRNWIICCQFPNKVSLMMAINWIAVRLASIFQIGFRDHPTVLLNLEYEHFFRRFSSRRQKRKQLAVLGIVVCNANRLRSVSR